MAKKRIEEVLHSKAEKETTKATEIELWPLARLKPYKRNAKLHPKEQIDLLARIVQKHGFDQPIVVDGKGVIVKGHGRWLAAQQLGLSSVPVIVRADYTATEAAEARIADNRVGQYGWDFEALVADVVGSLKGGFEIDITGFSLKELGLENDGGSQALDGIGNQQKDFDGNEDSDDETGEGTGELDLGQGAHTCPRCSFTFG